MASLSGCLALRLSDPVLAVEFQAEGAAVELPEAQQLGAPAMVVTRGIQELVICVPEDGSPAEIEDLWNSKLDDPSAWSPAQPEPLVDCAQRRAAVNQGRMGNFSILLLELQEYEPYLKVLLLVGHFHYKDSSQGPFVDQIRPDQEEGGLHTQDLQVQLGQWGKKNYLLLLLKSAVLDI